MPRNINVEAAERLGFETTYQGVATGVVARYCGDFVLKKNERMKVSGMPKRFNVLDSGTRKVFSEARVNNERTSIPGTADVARLSFGRR